MAVRFPAIVRSTLPNGVRVWTIPHATIPVVSAALVLRAGAAHDPADRHGLASLVAHLAEEGAGGHDAIQLAEMFARMGTNLDADAGSDVTSLSLTVLTRFVEPALRLLAQVVTRPHLAEGDLQRVRELRMNRLRQLSRSPATPADRAFLTTVFGGHPYGHGVLGTTKSLALITVQDAAQFHDAMWRPATATLIVAGQIDHDLVTRVAADAFSSWTGTTKMPADVTPVPPPGGASEILLVDRPGAQQTELRVGHTAPSRHTPDYHALVTLNNVLGADFSSRINRNLRETKGLTYVARSAFDLRRSGGSFVCQTSVQPDGTTPAIVELLRECEEIRQDGSIQPDELSRAKSSLTRGYVRHFEAGDDLVRGAVQLAAYDLPDDTFDRFVPQVESLRNDQIVDAARRLIRPDAFKIVVVGDATQCRAQLETLNRPVLITTPEF
jgi:predicted Zn-dependent peptidase